jgi:hypothetical protein
MDEIEEVILALKAAGWAVPPYKILDDGVLYFDNRRQETSNPPVRDAEPRSDVG